MNDNSETITTIGLPDDYEGSVRATLISRRAEGGSASAVLYVHGYLDYYFQQHMGEYFARAGHNFYAVDLRKYGRSWMPHQHFNYCRDMTEYFPEIDAALERIAADGNTDITLLGHSTGGLLCALYCGDGPKRNLVDRLILNSPFLEFNTGRFNRSVVIPLSGALSRLFPYASAPNQLSPNYFRSVHKSAEGEWDFDVALKPAEAPPLWFAWLRAVRKAQRRVRRGAIRIPTLVLFSDRSSWHKKWHDDATRTDTVLDVAHIARYGAMLGTDVTLREIPGGMHDLVLSRPEVRDRVLDTMERFIAGTTR